MNYTAHHSGSIEWNVAALVICYDVSTMARLTLTHIHSATD